MRKRSLLALIAVSTTVVWACEREPLGPSGFTPGPAALSEEGSSEDEDREDRKWIVDDDRDQCPGAQFTKIQDAVDAAAPGDKIVVCAGTYREGVEVSKNDLVITAKGGRDEDDDDGDRRGSERNGDERNGDDERSGRDVVVDAHHHEFGFLVLSASGVTIEGFHVKNAHEADIVLAFSTRSTIRNNLTTAAGHDGIQLFDADDNLIVGNVVADNLAPNACGINLAGDAEGGSERNTVRGNRAVNNEWGIQIAGPTTLNNVITGNTAVRNRGNGIRNVGAASGTIIKKNRADRNGFAPSALTGATNAGIRTGSGTGIVVKENRAFRNSLFDLRNDAGPGATFKDNRCKTSSPPGLCERDRDDD